jgi:hypothetical protein
MAASSHGDLEVLPGPGEGEGMGVGTETNMGGGDLFNGEYDEAENAR